MEDYRIALVAKRRAEAEDFRQRADRAAAWSSRDAAHYTQFAYGADESADRILAQLKEEGIEIPQEGK